MVRPVQYGCPRIENCRGNLATAMYPLPVVHLKARRPLAASLGMAASRPCRTLKILLALPRSGHRIIRLCWPRCREAALGMCEASDTTGRH
jgi:hypothetical protein